MQSLEVAGIVYEIHYFIEKTVCLRNIVIAIAFHLRKVNFAHNFPFLDSVPDVHPRHSLLGSEPSPRRRTSPRYKRCHLSRYFHLLIESDLEPLQGRLVLIDAIKLFAFFIEFDFELPTRPSSVCFQQS